VRERDAVPQESPLLGAGAALLMHIIMDSGPEGVTGTTYRTTEVGAWRKTAFMGDRFMDRLCPGAAGLLNVARTLLTDYPDGTYRLTCDTPKNVEPLKNGGWWSPKGARVIAAGGVGMESFANPFFPALRSGHRLFQRPSRQKQIPSSYG